MGKRKLLLLLISGIILTWRFLFVITILHEERFAESNDPLRVIDVKRNGNEIIPLFSSFKEIRIGRLSFLINTSYEMPYPAGILKIDKKEYIISAVPYSALIVNIYLGRTWLSIFGKNIYSERAYFLFTFLLFLLVYMKFIEKFIEKNKELLTIYLITFPIFGAPFALPPFYNQVVLFIMEIIFLMKLKKILEERTLNSIDAFYLLAFSGLFLHFHLIIGGIFLFSVIIAFLLTERKISLKIKVIPLIFSGFLFLLLIFPYIISPFTGMINFLFKSIHPKASLFLFLNFIRIIMGVFAPLSYVRPSLGIQFLPFSLPSGIILLFGLLGLFFERKRGKFEKLLFITSLLSLLFIQFLLFYSPFPHHINYILLFFIPYIPYALKRIKIFSSDRAVKIILIFAIFYNYIQLEVWRKYVNESSDSLSLHRKVADYLIENDIKRINDLAGPHGYKLISNGMVEAVDWTYFIEKYPNRNAIYTALLALRNQIVLFGSKKGWYKKGLSFEDAVKVADEIGLKIEVLKKFPSDEKYLLVLARVVSP